MKTFWLRLTILAAMVAVSIPAWGWDSRLEFGLQFGLPMHTQFTVLAHSALADKYRTEIVVDSNVKPALIDGCLTEMHELHAHDLDRKTGAKYGLDVEKLRMDHKGTNAGCNDIAGWWTDALAAYRAGRKTQAYYLVGIMLHMVQDMGVPAHANRVEHQGNPREFDNFEINAAAHLSFLNFRGAQDTRRINKTDPNFAEPWKYYAFSESWTKEDAPGYNNRDSFPKFRLPFFFTKSDEELMKNRQIRTWAVTTWALDSAIRAFLAK